MRYILVPKTNWRDEKLKMAGKREKMELGLKSGQKFGKREKATRKRRRNVECRKQVEWRVVQNMGTVY